MVNERTKYLLRAVLGVDVDEIVGRVVASLSIERAIQAKDNSEEWRNYMKKKGGMIILPRNVVRIGKK